MAALRNSKLIWATSWMWSPTRVRSTQWDITWKVKRRNKEKKRKWQTKQEKQMFSSYRFHLVATQQGTLTTLVPSSTVLGLLSLLWCLFKNNADSPCCLILGPCSWLNYFQTAATSWLFFLQLLPAIEMQSWVCGGCAEHRCRPSPEVPMWSHVASPLIVVAFPFQHFLAAEDGETHTGHRIVNITVVHKQVSHLMSTNHNRIHSNYSKFSTSSSHYHDQHGLHSLPSWI